MQSALFTSGKIESDFIGELLVLLRRVINNDVHNTSAESLNKVLRATFDHRRSIFVRHFIMAGNTCKLV